MNQPDDLPRRPNPIVHIPIHEHLPPPLPTHRRRHVLKLPTHTLPLSLHRLLGDFIRKQPTRVPPPAQHELRIRLLRLHNGHLDIVMDGRFDRAHEPRAHIDALGAQRQRGREPLPVREAAAGDERDRQALPRPGQQDEVGDVALADVAGALEAVDGEEVDAEGDGAPGVPDRGALVQDGAAGGLELPDHGAGGVAGRFDDADPLVDDGLGVAVVVGGDEGGEEGQVHAEGVWGHGFAALDLFAEVGGGGLG